MADVFISYSRRDKDFVARLNEALAQRGKDPWVDWEDIPASAEWFREIQDGIDTADAFLYVLSPDSVSSEVCARELEHALERSKRIVPILHREVDPGAVHAQAAALNWVYLRDDDAFDSGVDTLVGAIDTDLEHVRAHTRWSAAALDWERSGRNGALLLRGTELEEAQSWLAGAASHSPAPTELQGELVQASREAARRRQRILFASVSLALVVAVALSIVALIQRSNAVHQSKVAFARQLDANAQNAYDSDPELSVLLAAEAARRDPGDTTTEALRAALARSQVRETYRRPAGVGDAQWSPDGKRLLIARDDDRIEIVRPGASTKPIVLDALGISGQIAWSQDGKLVAAGGQAVRVYDAASGRLVRTLGDLPASKRAAAAQSRFRRWGAVRIAMAGRGRIAWVDLSGAGHVADISSGRRIADFAASGDDLTSCFAVSPDGRVAVQCTERGADSASTVRLFDTATGRSLGPIRPGGLVTGVDFSPDSRRLVYLASRDDAVDRRATFVYDLAQRRNVVSFRGAASAVAFSKTGSRLAWATVTDHLGHVYDFRGRSEHVMSGHVGRIDTIEFDASGTMIVTGGLDHTARVWDASTGRQLKLLAGHDGDLSHASFNDDGTLVATSADDGTVRVWATAQLKAARTAQAPEGDLNALQFSPDGSRLLVSGDDAELLDARTLRRIAPLPAPAGHGYAGAGHDPSGRYLVTLAAKPGPEGDPVPDTAQVHDARTGKQLASFAVPGSPIINVTFSPDGDRMATGGQAGDVAVWDPRTGRRLQRIAGKDRAQGMAYSPDGRLLAIAHAPQVEDQPVMLELWREGRRVRRITGPPQESQIASAGIFVGLNLEFSGDGEQLLLTGADEKVHRFDVATGKERKTLVAGNTFYASLVRSHDGRTLAAGNANAAELFRLPDGDHAQELKHVDPSQASFVLGTFGVTPTFTDDDRVLLTSGDARVKAWHTDTGLELFDLFGSRGAITPDGSRIAATVGDQVQLFACDLCGDRDELLALAGRRTTRGFTPAERAAYLHES